MQRYKKNRTYQELWHLIAQWWQKKGYNSVSLCRWSRWDSNPLPFDCEPNALPDELLPLCYEKRVVLSDPTLWSISKLNQIHILICIESFTLYYLFYMIIIHHFRQKPFLKVLLHNCNAKIRKLFELHTFYFQTLCNAFCGYSYKSTIYTFNIRS